MLGVELPPVDCDELDIRLPSTAFLRPFNVLGWAAIAIGDLQFVAPATRSCSPPVSPGMRRYGVMSLMSPAAGSATLTFAPNLVYDMSTVIRLPCGVL